MTNHKLIQLLVNEPMHLPVMFRATDDDGGTVLLGDDIAVSVSEGCGETEYLILDCTAAEDAPEVAATDVERSGR